VGDAEGVNVGGTAVSVAGGGEEGDAVGKGAGVVAGRNGVGESIATACVGGGRTPNVSSLLSRKVPSNIPTLTNVMTMLPSRCLIAAGRPALERTCPLTGAPQLHSTWSLAGGRCHPRMRVAG
jgi:hypothetical protein